VNEEFYVNPETREPHFACRGLTDDVIDVVARPELVLRGRNECLLGYGQTRNGLPPAASQKAMNRRTNADPNVYPEGWDRERVEGIIGHCESQSDEDAAAEIEAAAEVDAWILVPNELVREV
jgi:hypothetical protein